MSWIPCSRSHPSFSPRHYLLILNEREKSAQQRQRVGFLRQAGKGLPLCFSTVSHCTLQVKPYTQYMQRQPAQMQPDSGYGHAGQHPMDHAPAAHQQPRALLPLQ